jgi:archaellum component FlaF (FlaF/FlaG flagellin family)
VSFPTAGAQPGGFEDPAQALNAYGTTLAASRQPNASRSTLVIANCSSGANTATQTINLTIAGAISDQASTINANASGVTVPLKLVGIVPPGATYSINQTAGAAATIVAVTEYTL